MDYSVEDVGELTFLGLERQFNYDSAFGEIPKFWDEYCSKGLNATVPGVLGICVDQGDKPAFSYFIASFCDADAQTPEGYIKRTIAPHTWVKFHCVGKLPFALQKVNRQIFTEWLPSNQEYELAEGLSIEMYTEGDMQSDDYISEIWLPVVKK